MKPKYRRMLREMKIKEEQSAYLSAAGNKAKTARTIKIPAAPAAVWSLYILKCGDGSLYTGVTNDIDRRFLAHQKGKASRYTRTRRPVALVYREECGSRSQVLTRECAVKSMSRPRKDALILTSPAAPAYKSLRGKTRP
jgi:putative endonuclease